MRKSGRITRAKRYKNFVSSDKGSPMKLGVAAASILRPYISEKSYWVLQHHEIFQTHYYGPAWGVDPDLREEFSSSPHYEDCVRWPRNVHRIRRRPLIKGLILVENAS